MGAASHRAKSHANINNAADTVAAIRWRIYSSRYIYSGRYTVADTVPDIQYRIKIHIHRGRYTGADTQR